MVAQLIKKNDYFYCSNCRMKQHVSSVCFFCGYSFSNYAELAAELISDSKEDDKSSQD